MQRPAASRPWPIVLTIDDLARVLRTTIFHPFFALLLPLTLRAQATPLTHSSFILTTVYAAFVSLCWILSSANQRVAYGDCREVRLEDEVVLITGGANGLGRLLAEAWGRRGVSVAVLDIKASEGLDGAKAGVNANSEPDRYAEEDSGVRWYRCDVGDWEEVQIVAQKVAKDLGPPTILINNAAIVNGKPLLSLSTPEIDQNFRVNLISHFHTLRTFLPSMLAQKRGTIVTVSSVLAHLGSASLSDYTAAKAGLLALHASLAAELAQHPDGDNIKTILVTPGQLSTDMFAGVQTPSLFLGPVIEPATLAGRIIETVERGRGAVIAEPLYARWIQWIAVLPVGVQKVVRGWSGVDDAMREFRGRARGEAGMN
ncbi:hypothetical protein B0A49_13071 [Cryomyces minteri]|uniref:Ketoreductase domain-containing protein n=1 Tax=Cryomyces minteri TaxID=331657 RepID=A0A4U0VZW5_9PEZI|nr:hypothetical protein B0A49_13071 [Cryomyces minteri]